MRADGSRLHRIALPSSIQYAEWADWGPASLASDPSGWRAGPGAEFRTRRIGGRFVVLGAVRGVRLRDLQKALTRPRRPDLTFSRGSTR